MINQKRRINIWLILIIFVVVLTFIVLVCYIVKNVKKREAEEAKWEEQSAIEETLEGFFNAVDSLDIDEMELYLSPDSDISANLTTASLLLELTSYTNKIPVVGSTLEAVIDKVGENAPKYWNVKYALTEGADIQGESATIMVSVCYSVVPLIGPSVEETYDYRVELVKKANQWLIQSIRIIEMEIE